jgi:hypothetical protein
MKPTIYVLKLSGPPAAGELASAAPTPHEALVDPRAPTDLEHISEVAYLILYIVGHAVPNGLIDQKGQTVSEATVAAEIRRKRGNKPTVIVWDVCYAASFLDIPEGREWSTNYVHVFACQDYELTWHAKNGTTQFSQELQLAVSELNREKKTPDWDWNRLEDKLQDQLGTLQIPDVVFDEGAPSPASFGLYTFGVEAGA